MNDNDITAIVAAIKALQPLRLNDVAQIILALTDDQAAIETDNSGQIVAYLGVQVSDDDKLVPLEI